MIKAIIDLFVLDIIEINLVITAFVSGVIFTIAIIFTGTLSDYKESEQIPGRLAASFKTLFMDIKIATATINNQEMTLQMHSHLQEFLHVINQNFRQEVWKLREIFAGMEKIDRDIYELAANSKVPPQYIVKLRTELTNIDTISNRVETLKETTFIPAAYSISEITVGMVLIMLLFVRIDPFYAGFSIYGITAFLFVGLLMLIKQIDNPFAVRKHVYATVDVSILFKLEERLFARVE